MVIRLATYSTAQASSIASADVGGDMNASGTTHTLTQTRADDGWTVSGTAMTYTGSPDHVVLNVDLYAQEPENPTYGRITPITEVLRNGTVIGKAASTARHLTGNDEQSNTPDIIDDTPGTDPAYSLRSQQGGDQDDVLNVDFGRFVCKAVTNVAVRTN